MYSMNILSTIPDKPEMHLGNFLLNLLTESDKKESSLYVNKIEKIIQEIWGETIQKNWRVLDVRKLIPEKLGVGCSVFYAYKNGRKAIPIDILYKLLILWKEYCKKSDEELNKKWDSIFENNLILSTHSKHQKTILPKFITPKLSYLIGWLCGDGSFQQSHNYVIKISEKSTRQLRFVLKPLFKELFDVNTPIFQRYGNGYAVQIGSKPIFRFLIRVLKIKVGQIPEIVYEMDSVNKKYFLLGIFDSEGYVNSIYQDSKIVISQANRNFLDMVIELYKDIGIHFTGPNIHKNKLGTWYTIQIRKKSEILKFANLISSRHIDKLQKLQTLVIRIEKNWHS